MTDAFTHDRPYNTTLTDSRGARWHFYYPGADRVHIRKHDGTPPGDRFSRNDWTNTIDLNYGARDDVTSEWLDKRAAEWISDYNEDIEKGNV